MNRILYFGIALAAFSLAACEKSGDPVLELNVAPEVTLGPEASSSTITFTSTLDWYAEAFFEDGEEPWLTIEPAEGAGSKKAQVFTVSATSNGSFAQRQCKVVISQDNELSLTVEVRQDAALQDDLNSKLAVSKFSKYSVASLDETGSTVTFMTSHDCKTAGWFTWNEEWDGKVFTCDGKKYRIPTYQEYQLISPLWYGDPNEMFNVDYVSFIETYDTRSIEEELPEEILGKKGGKGMSYFKSSAKMYDVGDGMELSTIYAIRFTGTEQCAAYKYQWHDYYSEDKDRVNVMVKALSADSECSIDDIVDNEDFWKEGCLSLDFPCCGSYFSGEPYYGGMGTYWTASENIFSGGYYDPNDFATTIGFNSFNTAILNTRKDDMCNLRMVLVE